jgi:hypothetical protein
MSLTHKIRLGKTETVFTVWGDDMTVRMAMQTWDEELGEDDRRRNAAFPMAMAATVIAAIAQVASVTIEQISQAMGVQVPQASAWVPVSERLPDTDGAYLVQWKSDAGDGAMSGFWFEAKNMYAAWENGNIVAWRPLPERWKGE